MQASERFNAGLPALRNQHATRKASFAARAVELLRGATVPVRLHGYTEYKRPVVPLQYPIVGDCTPKLFEGPWDRNMLMEALHYAVRVKPLIDSPVSPDLRNKVSKEAAAAMIFEHLCSVCTFM